MRLSQFLFLVVTTGVATYWMNHFLLEGQVFGALFAGFFVVQNLLLSYRVTKLIRLLEQATKKKD